MTSSPTPNTSALGRLGGTGLFQQGGEMLRRLLGQKPDDANLWVRLAELERSAGHLGEAARCYRRAAEAANLPSDSGEVFRTEMRAIAAMLEGAPEALVALEPRRVVPFLLGAMPIDRQDLASLMDELAQSAAERRQGKVVESGSTDYNPAIREALARSLSPNLEAATMQALEPAATKALQTLFPNPPKIVGRSHSVIDYAVGGGYAPHPDRGRKGARYADRIMTVIVYLDVDDEAFSGGDLLIHDASGNGVTRLRPKTGMTVVFPSEAVHEVTLLEGPATGTLCRRTTLAVWYEEAAAS